MDSLENNTKLHYMMPYDPEYVKDQQSSNYDPHMALLVVAGEITKEDYEFYVNYEEES